MGEWEKTKKRRFRLGDNDKLILQVQDERIHTFSTGGNISSEWIYRWRDAEIQDLTEHDEFKGE